MANLKISELTAAAALAGTEPVPTVQSVTTVATTFVAINTYVRSTMGAGVSTFLTTPSSANLLGAITDETGSGLAVFNDTPTLIAPVLGAATATSVASSGANSLGAGSTVKLVVPTADPSCTGPTTSAFNSGYTSSAIGDLVYLDSSATWQKTDANTAALYNGMLGIALAVAATGAPLLVALPGSFVYAAAAFPTFTIGGPIYMSETPGVVTQTAPTTTDSATRVVGWGVHADKMYFFPSPDYGVHA